MSHRPYLGVALLGLALVAGSVAPAAAAEPVRPVSSAERGERTARSARLALAYWTQERMEAARPAVAPRPPRARPRIGASDQAGGTPLLVPGSEPVDTSPPERGATPATYAYPFPYTRYAVETVLYQLPSYRAIGKIFFRRGSTDFVCSGASVVGGPRHIVMTAGHCLNDGGVFSELVVFVPAYRPGDRPFGTFPAKTKWVPSPWAASEDLTYDIGVFDVAKNGEGRTLGAAVGKLGFASDYPRELHWNVFGYPAAPPFNGATMHVCQASHAGDDLSTPGVGPDPIAIGCDLTGGSSGGPWVLKWKRGSIINSVISYGYDSMEEASYGPYFDATANAVRCAAATGNGAATTC